MLFTDPIFLFLFLPLVLGIYFISPKGMRNLVLVCASLAFYAFGERFYVCLLLLSVFLNYFGGLALAGSQAPKRRLIFTAAVAGNLLLLAVFKYTSFIISNLSAIMGPLVSIRFAVPTVHLPIGISFFTFMGISYLADIYRRQLKAQRSLTNFALYLTLFPHLIAGPIVRYGDIAREIIVRRITLPEFTEGITRFSVGFGKKMIIANTLALTADGVFLLGRDQLTPAVAWLGALCYTLQIYYDFSGYSDMAIGLARLFGFHFPENFNYPYVSSSITEFWKRWHMSLSTWLRDYLFFPLGIRLPAWRVYVNVMIVFFLCGLWHGASWSFVFWGLYQGAFLVWERAGGLKFLERVGSSLRHSYAMLVIFVGWVFFRALNITSAFIYLRAMFGGSQVTNPALRLGYYLNPALMLVLVLGVIGCTPVVPLVNKWHERLVEGLSGYAGTVVDSTGRLIRLAAVVIVFVSSAAMSAAGTYSPFIYFRF